MLLELLKNYADMINSATRMTQRSATAMARTMLIQAGMEPAADMVSELSEQMIAAQEAQYAMMRRMIQAEVDMTVARMGVLPAGGGSAREETAPDAAEPDESVAELKVLSEPDESVAELKVLSEPASAKRDGDTAESAAPDDAEPVAPEPTRLQPVRQARESAQAKEEAKTEAKPAAAAKKAPAKRTAAKKTTTRKMTAPRKSVAAKSAPTKSAAAKSAPAKSTAKKAPAKSTAKAPSTRSTTKTPSGGSGESPKADS